MYYQNITHGIFRARPNRFVAEVETANGIELVHVKNTGRCRELLVPGYTVYLEASENPNRKTRYDLVAVKRDNLLINMDAQAPNQVFIEWAMDGHFLDGLTLLRSEYRWGQSRFDFYWEAGTRKGLVEVKGCTLEKAGLALFPDAPTERGVKHLHELTRAVSEGFECTLCIVIQMKGVHTFRPNDDTHRAFGEALRQASKKGVKIMAMDCLVTPESLQIDEPVAICLN